MALQISAGSLSLIYDLLISSNKKFDYFFVLRILTERVIFSDLHINIIVQMMVGGCVKPKLTPFKSKKTIVNCWHYDERLNISSYLADIKIVHKDILGNLRKCALKSISLGECKTHMLNLKVKIHKFKVWYWAIFKNISYFLDYTF